MYILNVGIIFFLKCVLFVVLEMMKYGFYYRIFLWDFFVLYVGNGGGIVIFSCFFFVRLVVK